MKKTLPKLNLKQMSDEQLAQSAQDGSLGCFAELVDRYSPRMYHFFRYKVNHEHDAEDLTQDTFIKAFKNIHRYLPRYRFSTWLFTIATRLAISFYRTASREKLVPIPPDIAIGPEPDDIAAGREEQLNLWILARKLPNRQHDVLWLRYVENMPIKEISHALGITQINVKVQLYRARIKLAEWHRIASLAQQITSQPYTVDKISMET